MANELGGTRDLLTSPDDFPAEELFAAASSAVLLADEVTGRVLAVNPAAQRLLGVPGTDLVGQPWQQAFGASCATALQAAAQQAVQSGRAVQATASSLTGGATLIATVSSFQVSRASRLLVRLAANTATQAPSRSRRGDVFDELDALAVGFVLTDGALCVEFGNKAFLGIVNQPSTESIEGQCVLRWLNLTQENFSQMRRQMGQREACMAMTTTLCIGPTVGPMVEVLAVAVPDPVDPHWGFILRRVPARFSPPRELPDNA